MPQLDFGKKFNGFRNLTDVQHEPTFIEVNNHSSWDMFANAVVRRPWTI